MISIQKKVNDNCVYFVWNLFYDISTEMEKDKV